MYPRLSLIKPWTFTGPLNWSLGYTPDYKRKQLAVELYLKDIAGFLDKYIYTFVLRK